MTNAELIVENERLREAARLCIRLFVTDDISDTQANRIAALAESIGEPIQRWAWFYMGTRQRGYDYFLSETAARRALDRHCNHSPHYDVRTVP